MKKVISVINKIMDKIVNAVKKQGSCVECGDKIPPELRLCDDCSGREEMLIAEQISLEDFEAALKVVGPVRPDFDEYFGWREVQDAYAHWAYSSMCPSLMEVCDLHIPFDRGTPEYAWGAGMIQAEIERGIEEQRRRKEEKELETAEKNDPFLNLISDREFMRGMDQLYWEIRVEEKQGQTFRDIMNRRLEEMGFQHGTPEWDAAKEGIRHAESEVHIGYAEANGHYEEEQSVREWEKQEMDAALARIQDVGKSEAKVYRWEWSEEDFCIEEERRAFEFEEALKAQGPIEPDFDELFDSWNVQDAYTDWAYSPDCPGLMEVAERHVPFAMGTPEYRKAVEMINRKIQEEIQMMREAREEEALRAEEALL